MAAWSSVPWRVQLQEAHLRCAVIVVIPCSGDERKPGEADNIRLPRQCPGCQALAVVGHGWRRRLAQDQTHSWIRVRRGFCKACRHTVTILPAECIPGSHYSFPYRRQTLEHVAAHVTAARAAPDCLELDCVADESTVRRWWKRRLESLARLKNKLTPTLFAWDHFAGRRILIPETNSP